jgi:hypothetical protein
MPARRQEAGFAGREARCGRQSLGQEEGARAGTMGSPNVMRVCLSELR